MTDTDLVEKKLAFIETCVRELHDLCQPERIPVDIREERFAAHTLQIAIQAAQDIASHINLRMPGDACWSKLRPTNDG